MTLFEQIMNEASVAIYGPPSAKKINSAIDNRNTAIIRYKSKGKNEHTQQRTIFPVAYGVNKKGNQVVRAYQTGGDTTTVKPGWKFFRVDRILSWYNMRKTKFDMRMLVNLGYNRDGDKLMTQLFNNVKTKAQTDQELNAKKQKETPKEKPIITPNPVSKTEVNNQSNTEYQPNISNDATVQSSSKNIDNSKINNYNNSDSEVAKMTAPETTPITKSQINGTVNNKDYQDMEQPSNDNLKIDGDKPVSKSDIESNPLTDTYQDLMRRFAKLDNNDNDF